MDPITGISLGRIGIGALAALSPASAARLFGLDAAGNRQLPFMTRMFASREIVVGATTLLASGPARERLALAGIAVDAVDGVAGYLGGRDGSLSGRTTALMTAVPAGAVLAAVATLVVGRRGRRAG